MTARLQGLLTSPLCLPPISEKIHEEEKLAKKPHNTTSTDVQVKQMAIGISSHKQEVSPGTAVGGWGFIVM